MVLVISCFVILFLAFCTIRTLSEQKLLKNKIYKNALDEWEKFQVLCLCNPDFRFTSFVVPLDPECPDAKTVTVKKDSDGKIVLPSGLKPSEFIVFINVLKNNFIRFQKGSV